jgi:hypothetical protein
MQKGKGGPALISEGDQFEIHSRIRAPSFGVGSSVPHVPAGAPAQANRASEEVVTGPGLFRSTLSAHSNKGVRSVDRCLLPLSVGTNTDRWAWPSHTA